ncbi:MAG: hypothetical protein J6N53_13570 [Lachnospiraceae bacterium]|nr:hypothetical protein [Lachnospiraceae bacterium]
MSYRDGSKPVWFYHAVRYTLRRKFPFLDTDGNYCKRRMLDLEEGSHAIEDAIRSGKPFMAGRLGGFELAVMRMCEFGIKKKYALTVHNAYMCSGFFPDDTTYVEPFTEVMLDAYRNTDIFACCRQFLEPYFVNRYVPKESVCVKNLGVYDVFALENHWTKALAGKKVLVVTSFPDSVRQQYAKREQIYPGTDILPEFDLQVYRSVLTIGDLKDERFGTWFEALDFMKKEILERDFDIALLSCGAYGFPLASEIKKAGRQAIYVGGVLQILFGILGRRWDGSRFGGIEHMPEKLKPYYSDAWIYPVEERPKQADNVEYGPYWK